MCFKLWAGLEAGSCGEALFRRSEGAGCGIGGIGPIVPGDGAAVRRERGEVVAASSRDRRCGVQADGWQDVLALGMLGCINRAFHLLEDAKGVRVEPLLPTGRCGARRVDDRRVISGIVHMLRIGARWRDCPAEYGPYTTIYNRFHRWSRQGVWFAVFEAPTGHSGAWGSVAIDSGPLNSLGQG